MLLHEPLTLLRFGPPVYETWQTEGSVTWPIDRGLLVSKEGRGSGFLRLSITRLDSGETEWARLRAQMEVRNFYPWLRGGGHLTRLGAAIYGQTQQRIHRFVTRRFLRSIGEGARASRLANGRGWFRTSDLSRVKRWDAVRLEAPFLALASHIRRKDMAHAHARMPLDGAGWGWIRVPESVWHPMARHAWAAPQVLRPRGRAPPTRFWG